MTNKNTINNKEFTILNKENFFNLEDKSTKGCSKNTANFFYWQLKKLPNNYYSILKFT